MSTLLEQWWSIDTDPTLTQSMKDDLHASLRVAAFETIDLPVIVSGTDVTITSVDVIGNLVECHGTGPVSWPLRLYNPPIGTPDSDGSEIDARGARWRTDPFEVIAEVIRNLE